jgi:hypothetical protein
MVWEVMVWEGWKVWEGTLLKGCTGCTAANSSSTAYIAYIAYIVPKSRSPDVQKSRSQVAGSR